RTSRVAATVGGRSPGRARTRGAVLACGRDLRLHRRAVGGFGRRLRAGAAGGGGRARTAPAACADNAAGGDAGPGCTPGGGSRRGLGAAAVAWPDCLRVRRRGQDRAPAAG